MKVGKTERGFEIIEFTDSRGTECTIQQSSAIDDTERGLQHPGSSYLWIGTDVMIHARMHVDRDQAAELVTVITRWLETGRLSE